MTRAFGVGMFIAIVAASYGAGPDAGVGGMLAGFDVGPGVRALHALGRVFAEFPFPVMQPFAFLPYFRSHWPLALERRRLLRRRLGRQMADVDRARTASTPSSGLVSYPDYDSALFLASLTIVPSMAVFVVNVETRFFDRYHKFYRRHRVARHAGAHPREPGRAAQARCSSGRGSWCVPQVGLVTVARSCWHPRSLLRSAFRTGSSASSASPRWARCSSCSSCCSTIVLSYLDLNRLTLALHGLFFATNAVATTATLWLGFPAYGYGFFLASVVAFLAACVGDAALPRGPARTTRSSPATPR